MTQPIAPPEVEFFLFYPEAPPLVPASNSVNGSLPVRATQLCPPVTTASGFGWYIFPPLDFAMRWDGQESHFSLLVDNEPTEWRSLAGGKNLFLSDGMERFGELPDDRRRDIEEMLPPGGIPIANADPRGPFRVELQFGLMARTSPGWASLVRSAPNWPYAGYQVLEGIIDTSWSRSLIPVMVQFTEPQRVVRFYRNVPAAALQVVPEVSYSSATTKAATVTRGASAVPEDIWREHVETRTARYRHERPGNYMLRQRRYAAAARKSQGAGEVS